MNRTHAPFVSFVLLGLPPEDKYKTTWERMTKAVHDHVPGPWKSDKMLQKISDAPTVATDRARRSMNKVQN